MIEEEAPDDIVIVSDSRLADLIGRHQKSGVLDPARRQNAYFPAHARPNALQARDLYAFEVVAGVVRQDARRRRVEQCAHVGCIFPHELWAEAHHVEAVDTRAGKLPKEGTQRFSVELRLRRAAVH